MNDAKYKNKGEITMEKVKVKRYVAGKRYYKVKKNKKIKTRI